MPNWCSNNVSIRGPKDKIKAIWETAQKDDGGLLQGMVPMPDALNITAGFLGDGDEQRELERKEQENLEKYGHKNWYDWHVAKWGTKWDVSNEGLEYIEDGDTAEISGWFESAWAPPTQAFATYGYLNEDVTIVLTYYEPGMCFVGRFAVEGGVDDDEYYEYGDYDSKTVRDAIGAELDDEWNISESMAEYEEENAEE